MEIVLNGRWKTLNGERASYAMLVGLWADDSPELADEADKNEEELVFKITFRGAAGERVDGTLTKGEWVEVKHGTVFNVSPTGSA